MAFKSPWQPEPKVPDGFVLFYRGVGRQIFVRRWAPGDADHCSNAGRKGVIPCLPPAVVSLTILWLGSRERERRTGTLCLLHVPGSAGTTVIARHGIKHATERLIREHRARFDQLVELETRAMIDQAIGAATGMLDQLFAEEADRV
ncbi:hypothetical protein ACIBH1_45370 [Nonomuraea sp. NPDC050663]|uniref:hypothetical protein n=1 Tax=Nonomuraea sp. NPDC050663 TaxID=3364370 RepID=UPI0037A6C603